MVEQSKPFVDFVSGLDSEDTLAVEKLINNFMTYAQNKQYGQAVAMLYKADPENAWNEPLQLSNEEMNEVILLLKRFSFGGYRISNMKFESALMNEVKCAIVENDTMPTVISNWYFKPINYLGGWRLCLLDSSNQ